MSTDHKLSLPAAILVNINIMLGTGIFINTVELSKRAGFLGSFMYPLIGLLILPLIIIVAQLMKLHPSGGFYTFGAQEIHPYAGFLSAWSYFTGKLASAMLMIHVAMLLCQYIIPTLASINIFVLDALVLALFIFLNTQNMRTGSRIQMGFLIVKLIPVLFVLLAGLFFLNPGSFDASTMVWSGIPLSLPLVLYAAAGFEASCSLSSRIHNAERNGPRAIFISFGLVMTVLFLFQFLFYALLGDQLAAQANYLGAFPALLGKLFGLTGQSLHTTAALFHLAIAASALGGSYGIIYSNMWNLYTIAQHGHIFFKNKFISLSAHHIPLACVLAEGILMGLYLAISQGVQVPLQQISALASAISYSLCVASLVAAKRARFIITSWLTLLAGIISCILLVGSCIRGLLISGLFPFIIFLGLLILGSIMFFSTNRIIIEKNNK
ncbi:MAG: APC family permease [Candidatus Dependentiae bacterium]